MNRTVRSQSRSQIGEFPSPSARTHHAAVTLPRRDATLWGTTDLFAHYGLK